MLVNSRRAHTSSSYIHTVVRRSVTIAGLSSMVCYIKASDVKVILMTHATETGAIN